MSIIHTIVSPPRAHVGSVLHGGPSCRLFGGVTFNKGLVDDVGERKLGQVLGDILLHLVRLESGSLLQSLGSANGHGRSLVTDRTDVLVVDDLELIPFTAVLGDFIGDSGGLGKRRDVLADLVEGQLHLLGHHSRELSLGLVTADDDLGVRVGEQGLLGGLGDGRVDTAAETSVRGDGDVKDLGIRSLLDAGLVVEFWEGQRGKLGITWVT